MAARDDWWISNEIKDFCRKATEADATSIYQPLLTKGWRLVIKPKPGRKFAARSLEFNHPYQLLKMVEFLKIASVLYPEEPIMNDPVKIKRLVEALAAAEERKTGVDREWEENVRNWKK